MLFSKKVKRMVHIERNVYRCSAKIVASIPNKNGAARMNMADFYTRFYTAVATSAANAAYAERVYGRNLCQQGFADLAHIDHLITAASLRPGQRALDIGCGNGMIAEYIANQSGAHVTGIDFAAVAIDQARARCAHRRDLAFFNMDIARLDLPAASFDAILSIDTLYFTELKPTLQALARLLKPGGCLAAYYMEGLEPWVPLETYPKEKTLPHNTPLAVALTELGLAYTYEDFTQAAYAHVQRRLPVLAELKPQFEAEGNQFLYDSHAGEANGISKAYEVGALGRYLYLSL
jgi:ubiquinone/menaquinone biosynthesis C-methylase UbiE